MMLTILVGIAGLGLMVFIHELGHFVAAKLNGVGVEVFSLGWGPRLAGFRRGGTSYQISWFPIGGYCKMKGELVPGIAGGGADAASAGAAATERAPEKGSFLAAAPWRRIVIAAFGPLFNVVFALLIFTALWWAGFNIPSSDNRVIRADDYTLDSFTAPLPAAVAGLQTGDRIVAIDGAPVEKFQDILEAVAVAPGRTLSLTVTRDVGGRPESITTRITPQLDKDTGAGRIGIYSWVDPVVGAVQAGSAAAIADLHAGDRLVEADGKPLRNTMDLNEVLAGKPAAIDLAYERLGARSTTRLVLTYDDAGAATLGIRFAQTVYRTPRLGLGGALLKSVEETWSTITLTVRGFGLLFQGIKIRNAVAGPLRITYYIGSAATSGFELGFGAGIVSLFRFLSFLSVVLFLMNLLPIPAMDGGQIVLFIVEILRGKPMRTRLIWRLQIIGFSLLICLSLFVFGNDILFFMGR